MLGRLSKGCLLASPIWVRGAKRMGAIRHRLWPVLSVSRLTNDHCADKAPLYGALSVARWVVGACRNYLAGNRGKPPGNRRFNGMAGESVALNPALRERNRNLKGCGLTGLLFFGVAWPLQPLGPKTPDSPRAGVARGRRRKGADGFSGKCGPAHFAGSHGSN
jgi:hypothetical protein